MWLPCHKLAEIDLCLIVILDIASDNMDEIEVQVCYMMCMCCFFVLNVMMAVCAISQRNNRNSIVEYEIESTSVKRRKRFKHLHRVSYESDIKCINELCMDRLVAM